MVMGLLVVQEVLEPHRLFLVLRLPMLAAVVVLVTLGLVVSEVQVAAARVDVT